MASRQSMSHPEEERRPWASLGYGCASLMGRLSKRESIRLLEVAFEAGITHFDVARSYGYGDAEGALGAFIGSRRRDEVTITTKLGIEPVNRSGLGLARAIARRVVPAGAIRRISSQVGQSMHHAGSFGIDAARRSLETSLRELGTERVEYLLLHEAGPEHLSDDLMEFLTSKLQEGTVGAVGIGSRPDQTVEILDDAGTFPEVVQVANCVIAPVTAGLGEMHGRLLFTHSSLGNSLERLHRHICADGARVERWRAETGVDCAERGELASLMLGWSRQTNPGGTVLVSARSPDRIRANTHSPKPAAEAVNRFAELVRADPVPGPTP